MTNNYVRDIIKSQNKGGDKMEVAKLLLNAIQNYLDCNEKHANHILNLILSDTEISAKILDKIRMCK